MSKSKTDPHNKAQQAYHARQTAAGRKRLSVYVPDEGREAFDRAMKRLRNKWRKEGLMD